MPDTRISSYDDVASEYYDLERHPTCANFSELSQAFLAPRLSRIELRGTNILEVGAGRSTVAPILSAQQLPMKCLTLLDKAPGMLAHSKKWASEGAKLIVGDACQTELKTGSFDVIVAALGDPYNCEAFWQEVARLLGQGGTCLFTTPALEWAARLRQPGFRSSAEFVISDGTSVLVPSYILALDQQVRMITDTGLSVIEMGSINAAHLSGSLSPKLLLNPTTILLPIVRGFVVQKL